MSKSIVLSESEWLKISNQIAKEYPPSVLLIRDRMRLVLGFTSRMHEEWFEHDVNPDRKNVGYNNKYCVNRIHLDFYNEPKRTMFLMKYSEYISHATSKS